MRTTITLDDDSFQAAQAQAQASGKHLGEFLSLMVRRGLKLNSSGNHKNGLPLFVVSTDSPIIPSGRANEILGEEMP